ncbi:MAG: hypothetical protein GY928_33740 [Colwellia sp.]|nr:hypothetical protein [Colwellia sp.]
MITIRDHFNPSEELFVEQSEIDKQIEQWNEIMKLAEKAGLIDRAGAGVAVLIHPITQLENRRYHRVQYMTGNSHRCKASNDEATKPADGA